MFCFLKHYRHYYSGIQHCESAGVQVVYGCLRLAPSYSEVVYVNVRAIQAYKRACREKT